MSGSGLDSGSSCGLAPLVTVFSYSGFIILVVPFVFSYMQEMQNEMIRMMESNELI